MGYLLAAVVVFLWLLVAGALYLQGRYRYSGRSRAVLAAEAPAALGAAYALTRALFPGLNGLARVLVVAALSLPLYLLMALVTVEIWRRSLTRHLDKEVSRLQEEEARCAEELEALQARARAGARAGAATSAPRARPSAAPARSVPGLGAPGRGPRAPVSEPDWLKTVEEWERSGGQARVRSLRVLEWRRELVGPALDKLAEEERALEAALPGAGERREQLEVRLALVRLELAARRRAGEAPPTPGVPESAVPGGRAPETGAEGPELEPGAAPAPEPGAAPPAPRAAPAARAAPGDPLQVKAAELQRLRAELAESRRRREEFLSRRILLE